MREPFYTADGQERSVEYLANSAVVPMEGSRSKDPLRLHLVIMEYEKRPNRGTIHPYGFTGIERMEPGCQQTRPSSLTFQPGGS